MVVTAAVAAPFRPADAQKAPIQGYTGQILAIAGSFCPPGTAPADGRTLPVAQYRALFAQIGNTFGGDGKTNFAVPNLNQGGGLAPTVRSCIILNGINPEKP